MIQPGHNLALWAVIENTGEAGSGLPWSGTCQHFKQQFRMRSVLLNLLTNSNLNRQLHDRTPKKNIVDDQLSPVHLPVILWKKWAPASHILSR